MKKVKHSWQRAFSRSNLKSTCSDIQQYLTNYNSLAIPPSNTLEIPHCLYLTDFHINCAHFILFCLLWKLSLGSENHSGKFLSPSQPIIIVCGTNKDTDYISAPDYNTARFSAPEFCLEMEGRRWFCLSRTPLLPSLNTCTNCSSEMALSPRQRSNTVYSTPSPPHQDEKGCGKMNSRKGAEKSFEFLVQMKEYWEVRIGRSLEQKNLEVNMGSFC